MENLSLIIGIPTESVWSTSTEYAQGESRLTVSMTIRDQVGDASTVGRAFLHDLQSWIVTNPSSEDGIRFFARYAFPKNSEFVIWFESLGKSVFAVRGGIVGVKRQGKFFEIVALQKEFQCVRGELLPSDILIFGTTLFATRIVSILTAVNDPVSAAERFVNGEQGDLDAAVCGRVQRLSTVQVTESVVPVNLQKTIRETTPSTQHNAIWLRFSPRYKKLLGALILVATLVVTGMALQQFVLSLRQRRISGVTAPLTSRLSAIVSSSDSRMEKEKKLSQLIVDTTLAKTTVASDIAITRELNSFELKLQEEYKRIAKRKELENLSVFYDFRLITADFVASQIQYDVPGKLAVFLDTARGKIVSLSLEKKQPQALTLNSDIGKLLSLTVVDRKAFLLGKSGVYKVSLPLDTQGEIVASSSSQWVSPERIGSFAKNIYVLDPGSRQIYRYDRDDFSASPSAWLRGKEGVDFDAITSISIDGDVWMGTTQGKIYKFTRGERGNFSFLDIVQPPDTSISIYTAEFLPNLYVLEPRANRIVIFDKSGAYVSSIVCPDFGSATSIVVDENGKKAYVLAGSLVYEVEL